MSQAEALVNKMNERLEANTVGVAEAAATEAEKAVLAAQEEVDRFRNAQIVVDPSENAIAQLSTITTLSAQVDQVIAQILANNKLSPSNPATVALKAQADALSAQIASEQKALAGSNGAVSSKVSAYERLTLLRTLADMSLETARQSLDAARTDARRQHVFVEEIVAPNLPDYSAEPQRLRSVATVFVVSLMAFLICGSCRSASRSARLERHEPDGRRREDVDSGGSIGSRRDGEQSGPRTRDAAD